MTAVPEQVANILDANIAPEVLLEVLYQLVPVTGTLKVKQALERVNSVFEERKITLTPAESEEDENYGAQVQAQLYGTEIKNLLKDLPDNAGSFIPHALTEHFFNDFYNRKALDVRDRERYELLALISNQGPCSWKFKGR